MLFIDTFSRGGNLHMSFIKLYVFKVSSLLFMSRLIIILLFSTGLTFAQQSFRDTREPESISIEAYETIGKAYADALNKKDIQKLAKMFDMESFAYATAHTVYNSKRDINSFVKGVLKHTEENFLRNVFNSVFSQESKAKFLRVLKDYQPLIRVDYNEGGHEYVILDLKRMAGNKLVIVDMFFLSSGKKLSVAIGAATQLMLRPSKSILKRLFGKVDVDTEMIVSIRKVAQLRKDGKYKEAYEIIEAFPDAIRNNRVMIDVSIQLSQFINDDEYRKQLTRLDKYYGKDETTAFILIDHHFYTKRYDKALLSVDRLIERFGVDGALLNLKASIYYLAKNFFKAQDYARKAIKQESLFEDAYWTLVTTLIEAEDYSGLVKALNSIEKKFGYTFAAEDFKSDSTYEKFVKTAEFRARFK